MDVYQLHELYVFNNERRENLLKKALEKPTKFEQMQFVVDYFLNNLPLETIAEIDGVNPKVVFPFAYDYSFLEDYSSENSRVQHYREYKPGAFGYTLPMGDNDVRVRPPIKIYPSIFALKMATCQMFASEIARFALDFGIDCKIIKKFTPCYDNFIGTDTKFNQMAYDRLIHMNHYYNIITIDGVDYKIDIAGGLTCLDFNKNHPESAVDPNLFYFSTKDINPFEPMIPPMKLVSADNKHPAGNNFE